MHDGNENLQFDDRMSKSHPRFGIPRSVNIRPENSLSQGQRNVCNFNEAPLPLFHR